ncbi:alpha/beta fold hydrolase [Ciceribacter sp. L1K22]|uniref:alpha/beta hydrolase n=1 Tax=Ciceribacter sp. L1K22 TaxID=2820275 RepID=UPI001ABE3885|nr:alpha/beta fold hydrolase [Ciceribacter sp. L1K22]MBO3762186.1 alpha/beta fold hydrolase [Ciceribacter sp. L1K22]
MTFSGGARRITLVRAFQFVFGLCAVLSLTACAGRPGPEALSLSQSALPDTKQVTVYVATTRENKEGLGYTDGKAPELNFAAYTVSVPPGHKAGEIEWPKGGNPDPAKTFAVTAQRTLSADEFYREVGNQAKTEASDGTDVGVFVHGFNFNFQESLFRVVQMSADANVEGVPVLFAWPSQAAVTGYLADKESVTYSRDYLAETLTRLTAGRGKGRVLLFGHSMGGWLVVETLRQLKLSDRSDVLAKLNVMLAAPDIDVDVFRQQMAVIGPMSPPLTILVSKDDRALQASQFLTGNGRIGALDVADPVVAQVAEREKILLVDVSGISPTNPLNHDRYVQLAALYPKLTAERQDLSSVGGFILDVAANTVSSPFRLVKLAITPQ